VLTQSAPRFRFCEWGAILPARIAQVGDISVAKHKSKLIDVYAELLRCSYKFSYI
jgi:hypothetical protein